RLALLLGDLLLGERAEPVLILRGRRVPQDVGLLVILFPVHHLQAHRRDTVLVGRVGLRREVVFLHQDHALVDQPLERLGHLPRGRTAPWARTARTAGAAPRARPRRRTGPPAASASVSPGRPSPGRCAGRCSAGSTSTTPPTEASCSSRACSACRRASHSPSRPPCPAAAPAG